MKLITPIIDVADFQVLVRHAYVHEHAEELTGERSVDSGEQSSPGEFVPGQPHQGRGADQGDGSVGLGQRVTDGVGHDLVGSGDHGGQRVQATPDR
ncbi:MAG: hypothetical protein QOI10_4391 [Solirubrobacterales bacterium]|jgi:hypothetical protein|nr:hypothetical protein [Solirubrobacterales bacterium]